MTLHRKLVLGVSAATLACIVFVGGCNSPSAVVTANAVDAESLRKVLNEGSGGAGPAGSALPDPTGFANLRGLFRIEGTPVSLKPLTVSGQDAAYCSPNGTPPPDERLVVGGNKGIRNVLIFLNSKVPADDPKWEHEDYAAEKFATLTGERGFDQKYCIFLSHVYAVRSTQKVEILNSDTVGHNTNITGGGGAKGVNSNLPAGSTGIYEPVGQSTQPFPVSCSVHPWMKAWMISRDSPYFAVTDEEGKFEIKNIPSGVELEFRVWQEKSGFISDVKVNGTPETWKKGRFKRKLDDQSEMNLDVEIDASVFN